MNHIHPIVAFFTNQGVPQETIILLLILPIVATLIAFIRQVVGIKAFGIYTPTITAFVFWVIGIKYAITIFVSVIAVGMLSRLILRKLRMLYLPRVAITITLVALATIVILGASGAYRRTGLASVSIFPLLILISLVEKFVAMQMEKGTKTALTTALETLAIALVGYLLISWDLVRSLIAAQPWIPLLTIPLNIVLGKWTGLRLTEYFRFRNVLKDI